MLLVFGVLVAACSSDSEDTGSGGGGATATEPADDGDAGDDGTGSDRNNDDDEERVASAVIDSYEHISTGDYDALWSTYTSAFQERCSFDDMVNFTEEFKRSEGWSELLPTQIKVDVLDDRAVAEYVVIQTSPDGFIIGDYDYEIIYFYEGGEWRAEETCF